MVRSADYPDMAIAVFCGHKATTEPTIKFTTTFIKGNSFREFPVAFLDMKARHKWAISERNNLLEGEPILSFKP